MKSQPFWPAYFLLIYNTVYRTHTRDGLYTQRDELLQKMQSKEVQASFFCVAGMIQRDDLSLKSFSESLSALGYESFVLTVDAAIPISGAL